MGVLDEAIREHLELKRRRGADVAEVTRQEREAFGPTGREKPQLPDDSEPADELHPALDEPGSFAAEAPPDPTRLHVAEPPAEQHLSEAGHLPEGELEREPPRPHGDPADHFPPAAVPEVEPEPTPAP